MIFQAVQILVERIQASILLHVPKKVIIGRSNVNATRRIQLLTSQLQIRSLQHQAANSKIQRLCKRLHLQNGCGFQRQTIGERMPKMQSKIRILLLTGSDLQIYRTLQLIGNCSLMALKVKRLCFRANSHVSTSCELCLPHMLIFKNMTGENLSWLAVLERHIRH